jgi:hypothetical protein
VLEKCLALLYPPPPSHPIPPNNLTFVETIDCLIMD